jgi:hypothetical protein
MAGAYRIMAMEQHRILDTADSVLDALSEALEAGAIDSAVSDVVKQLRADIAKVPTPESYDVKFREWGEEWHADVPVTYQPGDMINSKEAGAILGTARNNILRLRVDGRIEGQWNPDVGRRGSWLFRVEDVWKLRTERRERAAAQQKTDHTSGGPQTP